MSANRLLGLRLQSYYIFFISPNIPHKNPHFTLQLVSFFLVTYKKDTTLYLQLLFMSRGERYVVERHELRHSISYKTKELPTWTTLLLFLRNYEFSIHNSQFSLLLYSSLSSSQTCDWHTEWRATCVVHTYLSAELNR